MKKLLCLAALAAAAIGVDASATQAHFTPPNLIR